MASDRSLGGCAGEKRRWGEVEKQGKKKQMHKITREQTQDPIPAIATRRALFGNADRATDKAPLVAGHPLILASALECSCGTAELCVNGWHWEGGRIALTARDGQRKEGLAEVLGRLAPGVF